MALPVKLSEVVGGMEVPNQEWTVYLNKRTGEMVTVTPEDERLLEDPSALEDAEGWQLEELPKVREATQSEDYIALPGTFEIHEWSIMERFVVSIDQEEARNRLDRAIHGRGAFRRFKAAVETLGLREQWYGCRNAAVEEVAVAWLEDNEVPFVRD